MLLLFFVYALQITISNSQYLTKDEEYAVESIVESLRTCKNISGIGVALVRNGSVFARGYGEARVSSHQPFDNNTISNIGSVTKAFTVALLAILMTESKRFDWNSKVTEVIGEKLFQHNNVLLEMTIKDMVAHRTGLMNPDLPLITILPNITRTEYMRRFKHLPEKAPFRDKFIYNNFVYMMAGLMTEIIGGKPYEILINEKILKPLKMESSLFLDELFDSNRNIAYPHNLWNGTLTEAQLSLYRLHDFAPAGGLCSSPVDLSKWLRFLLNKGKTPEGVALIEESIFTEILLPHMVFTEHMMEKYTLDENYPADLTTTWYGYAWFGARYKGYPEVYHTGSFHAYSAVAGLFQEKHSGYVITANGPKFDFYNDFMPLTYYLSDLILHENKWLNSSTICTFPEPWQESKEKNKTKPKDHSSEIFNKNRFYGSYGHFIFGDIMFLENESPNLLSFQLNSAGKGNISLLFQENVTFSIHFDNILSEILGNDCKVNFLQLSDIYQQVNLTCGVDMYDFHRGIRFVQYTDLASSTTDLHQDFPMLLIIQIVTSLCLLNFVNICFKGE